MNETRKRAAELVRKGMSFGQAAKKLGVTRNVVASAARDAGLCRKGWHVGQEGRGTRVVALYKKGVLYREIARQCGLAGPQSVGRYLYRVGIKPNRQRQERA